MADRVSATITIGGTLDWAKLPDLIDHIASEGLSTEWDGGDFTAADMPENGPLELMAHEVAWGRFDDLEGFCVAEGLPFARWSGGYAGQRGPERVVFTGSGEPASYAADEDDRVVIHREDLTRLASVEAVTAYFDAADYAVPPLGVTP